MKYCSVCGIELTPRMENSHKRYSCKACGAIHYENPKPCVTAVVVKDDTILLTRRAIEPGANKWDLVGGFLERDEHPNEALRRELKEELGVQPKEYQFLGFFMDEYGDNGDSTLNIAFVCQVSGEPRIQVDEFDKIKWFAISELPEQYAFRSVGDILEAYMQFVAAKGSRPPASTQASQ